MTLLVERGAAVPPTRHTVRIGQVLVRPRLATGQSLTPAAPGREFSVRVSSPTVVAALMAAVLVGDAAGLVHVHGRQAADRAARAAAAADAAWVEEVRRLAEDLLLARAPISDAANIFAVGDLGDAVRYDVYVRGAASADLLAISARLTSLPVPAARAESHAALQRALEAMSDAVLLMADESDTDVEDEIDSFTAAARDWDGRVHADVATDLPSATTIGVDAPLTRAGQIFRWSSACARATDYLDSLGDPQDRQQAAEYFENSAASLDDLLDDLLAVRTVESDRELTGRELEPALRGMRETVSALRSLGDAIEAEDPAGGRAALVLLDRLAPLSESASRFFEERGSTVCSDHFDPGLLPQSGSGSAPDDETAT